MADVIPPKSKFNRSSCVLVLLALAVAVILVSKLLRVVYPPPAVPLFEPAAGLQAFSTADAAAQAGLRLNLPAQTFGAALYSVAEYAESSSKFPAGTTDAIYAKDGGRAFDVLTLPVGTSDTRVRALAIGTEGPDVVVNGVMGHEYASVHPSPVCVDATAARPIRFCQLGNRLIFGDDAQTTIVAVDGNALTEGELIMVARSIPTKTKTHTE